MIVNLEDAKKRVDFVDQLRLSRAIAGVPDHFQMVLELVPVLFHLNHPVLPGYVKGAPCGVANFEFSTAQLQFLQKCFAPIGNFEPMPTPENPAFFGIYAMGSIGCVTQTPHSDLDLWLCVRPDLNLDQKACLEQKITFIKAWANGLQESISLYVITPEHFRNTHYITALSEENDNSGSAQYMLLLDEFYRTAVRLAGKRILWLHLPVAEKDYTQCVQDLVEKGELNLNDWLDFGDLSDLSANEYFGATLWQLYKGIDSPHKSALKILLLESYSADYPNTQLLSQAFKNRLFRDDYQYYHFDAYLGMLHRVGQHLAKHDDSERFEFACQCFYLKIAENRQSSVDIPDNWRLAYLPQFAKMWHWSETATSFLDNFPTWKIKAVQRHQENLLRYLMACYRNLLQFTRQHQINAQIVPKDMAILGRKLYTAFESLPGKVQLLNIGNFGSLAENSLTFVEVKHNTNLNRGWYVINRAPNFHDLTVRRHSEFNETLPKSVAWAYFNGLLTKKTKLYIKSNSVTLDTLNQFVKDLCRSFDITADPVSNQALSDQCRIRELFIAINLTSDATASLSPNADSHKKTILAGDLFDFNQDESRFVSSIDLIYRNRWNEIRTLHFIGNNALLRAIKVLGNKIPAASSSLQNIQVYCYAKHYRKAIGQAMLKLVQRTLGLPQHKSQNFIKNSGLALQAPDTPMPVLRCKGTNWEKFFHINPTLTPNREENPVNHHQESTRQLSENCCYPVEIDRFASEGFLQFFFERDSKLDEQDNPSTTFTVFILNENNHLEIYRHCTGNPKKKINQINQIYQTARLNCPTNPYKIIKHHFNYPQFYQLLRIDGATQITPYPVQLNLE